MPSHELRQVIMKVGDLVMIKVHPRGGLERTGVVIDILQKKCWRTSERGVGVDWNKVEPEPHGQVLFGQKVVTIPVVDMVVVND